MDVDAVNLVNNKCSNDRGRVGNIDHAVPEPEPGTLMLEQLNDALEIGYLNHGSVQHLQVTI